MRWARGAETKKLSEVRKPTESEEEMYLCKDRRDTEMERKRSKKHKN